MSELLPSVEIDSEGFVLMATVLSSVPADDNVVLLVGVGGNGSVVAVAKNDVPKYGVVDVAGVGVAGDGSVADFGVGDGSAADFGVVVVVDIVVVTDGGVGNVVVGVVGQVWCRCASSLL